MTAVKQPDFITIADYLASEEINGVKREYVEGIVHAMAGATNQHNTIAGNWFASLHGQLRGKPCQPFNSDTKVRIQYPDHTRFYYPDAMVVCEANPATDHFQDQPVVIVEVLSDSTCRADLVEKRDAYFTLPSLKVLIFVETETPSITLHRAKAEGGFACENHSGPDAIIPLPEIETTLSLAEVYERITFPA
jgi:Uma2 family endonuclease